MTFLEIDPNLVKPGWTPLIITVALAGVMVLLFLSMRRQFRKINVPDRRPSADDTDAADFGVGDPGAGDAGLESRPARPPSILPDSHAPSRSHRFEPHRSQD